MRLLSISSPKHPSVLSSPQVKDLVEISAKRKMKEKKLLLKGKGRKLGEFIFQKSWLFFIICKEEE